MEVAFVAVVVPAPVVVRAAEIAASGAVVAVAVRRTLNWKNFSLLFSNSMAFPRFIESL